ncbi:MAG: hypothetical protein B7Y85_06185 [Brevundimonas sp. 32-68-21]|jgi:hypothetical protein|uniref:Uncharacterized protein n=1 Tax=Brevundimonas mediterranea TaxID=74329 RepID=A0AB37E6V4_9CAUL|nr:MULTISPECIES: hypothetical protein [Brevundimonas]MBU2348644.1 hypothetical protein [Alphaproteobacteria bacterium]OYX80206.1 MAG: hypothetical protein B7Y85_06185 [Brevundimonas sp. 32-68-21]MBA4330583.1 hypothetical protein [Brevundimonas sp.]QIH72680.1 hypothetical protein GYM46_06790 [Brevundimonas mediterranea]TAJ43100.1 MAG: hypothetical protein EPO54_08490 [Brevundimonas sp.]
MSITRIRAEREEIARQRAALDKRDADLAVAEKVLVELEGVDASSAPEAPYELNLSPQATTRREKIIEALKGPKLWMTSGEINKAIYKRHGVMIKTTSLYPMLTLMTKEGVLMRSKDKLALESRIGEGSQVND